MRLLTIGRRSIIQRSNKLLNTSLCLLPSDIVQYAQFLHQSSENMGGFHEKQTLSTYYGSDYLDAEKIDDNICQLQKQYIHKMADICATHLQSCSSIADLGGGTGYFTRLMLQQMQPPPERCACVDPYLAKDDETEGGIHFLKLDAVDYLEKLDTKNKEVDGFLLKEMLHHIPDQSRLFQNLARIFQQNGGGGRALIVTRPDNPHLLWFPRIAQVFKDSCVDIDSAKQLAEKAGLNWKQTLHDFPLEFTIDEWSELLRGRFWSIFKEFSEEELEEGIEYMRKQNADKSVLHFPDRYWLIDITLKV